MSRGRLFSKGSDSSTGFHWHNASWPPDSAAPFWVKLSCQPVTTDYSQLGAAYTSPSAPAMKCWPALSFLCVCHFSSLMYHEFLGTYQLKGTNRFCEQRSRSCCTVFVQPGVHRMNTLGAQAISRVALFGNENGSLSVIKPGICSSKKMYVWKTIINLSLIWYVECNNKQSMENFISF